MDVVNRSPLSVALKSFGRTSEVIKNGKNWMCGWEILRVFGLLCTIKTI